jgi:membrane-bound serine protease (ClpP class)
MDETMAKKMASDVAADARTWASRRGRNVQLAEEAVRESRSFTEDEAMEASPPLIDAIATDVAHLLQQLDGRTIKRFDGSEQVLRTAGANVVPIEMSWRQKVLSAIAHPNVAYILLSLGMLGLTVELWNPGSILPGVAGGICLLLAFFTFQILPVNYAGVLLLLFGIALLALEVKVTSHGVLGAGGVASLLFGSLMLMDAGSPEMRVSLSIILPVVFAVSAILVLLVRLGLAAQRARPFTGIAGMIGERGHVIVPIGRGKPGQVRTHGEIWAATADEPLDAGDEIVVSSIDGLMMKVARAPREGTLNAER